MRAIRLHAFGPPENLLYEEVDDPKPEPGQVRIAVHAVGVHLLDTMLRSGVAPGGPMPLPTLPAIPGREVAGVVDAVGEGVDDAWVGRRVAAHLGLASAGYAELAVTDVGSLHPLPDGLGFQEAVAMVGTGRTTLAILEVAELTPDDVVLVLAAAGGIGSLLVQAARNVGATVVGAAGGARKVAQVALLGADVPVDYSEPDWQAQVRQDLDGRVPTVAFDGVGGEIGRGAMDLLGPGGRLVIYGWASGEPVELTAGDIVAGGLTVSAAVGPRILQRPGGLHGLQDDAIAAAGRRELVPLVNEPFPLADAAAAHRALEGRATMGKVVMVP